MTSCKLFCIPYAGGAAQSFTPWQQYLDVEFELSLLELSGRGEKYKFPLYNSINDAVQELYNNIRERLNGEPYALFGHGLGGLIAYELYYKIAGEGHLLPFHIFLSDILPPHIKRLKYIWNLSDDEFLAELQKNGLVSERILKNDELVNIFKPILRADFKMMENYHFTPKKEKLGCSLTVFAGINDEIKEKEISLWSAYTSRDFYLHTFSPNNYFVNDEDKRDKIIEIINSSYNSIKLMSC